MAILTDEQAFGFRRGRESASRTDTDLIGEYELVEIEPLDCGGIILDSDRHLPLVLHRRDRTLWRLRKITDGIPDEITEASGVRHAFVIEKTDTNSLLEWEVVEHLHPDYGVAGSVKKFGDTVGVEVLTEDVSGEAIDNRLEKHLFWFDDADIDDEEQIIRDMMGMQDKMVLFDDEVPDGFDYGE